MGLCCRRIAHVVVVAVHNVVVFVVVDFVSAVVVVVASGEATMFACLGLVVGGNSCSPLVTRGSVAWRSLLLSQIYCDSNTPALELLQLQIQVLHQILPVPYHD